MANTTSADKPVKFRMADSGEGWHRGTIYSGIALEFDNTNDYVDVGDLSANCKTIMFCVYPDATTDSIIDLDGGTSTITLVSGTVTAGGFTSPTIYVDGIANTVINNDTFYHIAITTETAIDVNNLDIGRVSATYFGGKIADVRIYEKALTAEQVWRCFLDPENPLPAGVNASDLVLWMPFNENDGTMNVAYDHSSNGFTGTVTGASYETAKPKPVPQSMVSGYSDYYWFDGTDDDVSISGITADFDITGYFEMTIKFYMPSVTSTIFASSTGSTNRFAVMRNGGNFSVGVDDNSSAVIKSTTSYTVNKFYTCTLIVDNKTVTAYLDGVEMTTAGTMSTSTVAATKIGSNTGTSSNFTGIIVSVEQTGLHRWTNKGGWVDEIGVDDGTINGSPLQFRMTHGTDLTKDPYSLALVNSGGVGYYIGTEYTETPDTDNMDITSTISVDAWVKFDATGSQEMIIGKRNAYQLYKDSSEKLVFGIYQTTEKTATSTATLSIDTWYHVAATYDGGAGEMKLYIDGVLDTTSTSHSGNIDTTAFSVTTGQINATNYWTGEIDETRIYNDVLTAAEVLTNYRAGLTDHS